MQKCDPITMIYQHGRKNIILLVKKNANISQNKKFKITFSRYSLTDGILSINDKGNYLPVKNTIFYFAIPEDYGIKYELSELQNYI